MLVQCLITGRAAKRGLEEPKLLHSSKGEDRVTMNLKQRAPTLHRCGPMRGAKVTLERPEHQT